MLTLYTRASGIVCLETDVFEREADLPKLLGAMLAFPLVWQWSSTRRHPVHPSYAHLGLPSQREWTQVTDANFDNLAADLIEQDLNDDRRQVLLIGAEWNLLDVLSDAGEARRVLADFAAEQPPVRLVMVQVGDTGSVLIFSPRHPPQSVIRLLEEWGLSLASVQRRLPYQRLRLAQFETLFGLRSDL